MLFFNWYGYRIITSLMESQADQQLEARLDSQQYDEAELIEVKIPLQVPYQISQPEFERHYGEVEVDGKHYTYVKSKVVDGFLVLKCIANSAKDEIKAAGSNYYKKANGLDQQSSDKKGGDYAGFAKSFWSEYSNKTVYPELSVIVEQSRHSFPIFTQTLPVCYSEVTGQPPEMDV